MISYKLIEERTSVLPLIALDEKVKEVPVVTVPVFVMASVGFADKV